MAHLTLSLLGPLRIELDGATAGAFESDKVRALLTYLAVETSRAHKRAALAALLWPESTDSAARHNLRQALHNLREAIGDRRAALPFLLISHEQIQFNLASDHELDMRTFEALLAACDNHAHRQIETCAECAERLAHAEQLYHGGFLQEFYLPDSAAFEEWEVIQRETLQRRALAALGQLAAYHEARADYEAAKRFAQRSLDLDPWREEAHRRLMRALALSGQRSEALAHYEACKQALAKELGIEPSDETSALAAQIRRGELQPTTRALESPRTTSHFPVALTPFVGRGAELEEIARLLAEPNCRLLTLVGPGGVGKTRLASESGSRQQERFKHGAYFVALAPVAAGAPELIVTAIADALGVNFQASGELLEQLQRSLRGKELLLVLDNFEHLVEYSGLLLEIVREAPALKLLVTSREPLQLRGEWVVELEGLPVPSGTASPDADESALALFLQSARRALTSFALDDEDMASVVRICQLVDGMPLAIELAAAWVRTLSCEEIAQEIERSYDFLMTGARDVPARHRSLRAVFEHSWQMLPEAEQRVLGALSVFRGGFQREAAEQVAGASLSLLSSLVAKSLVRRTSEGRYDLHGLVRQYARDRLQAAGDEPAIRQRHFEYNLRLAERGHSEMYGAGQVTWLERLDRGHDNMREALGWTIERADAENGLRLANALVPFWFVRGYHREGTERLRTLLALPGAVALPLARARALLGLGFFALIRGDLSAAQAPLDEALRINRAQGNLVQTAQTLQFLGLLALARADLALARLNLEESLGLARQAGEDHITALVLSSLGDVEFYEGGLAQAQKLYEESASLFRTMGDKNQLAAPVRRLGQLALRQGFGDRAASLFRESLALNREVGDQRGVAACVAGLAGVATLRGQLEHAARLFGALDIQLHNGAESLMPADRMDYDRNVAEVRARLDAAAFEAARSAGAALTRDQLLGEALAGMQPTVGR